MKHLEDVNLGVIVNGNLNYSNFEYHPFTIPVLISLIPLIYIIPTCFIIMEIIIVFIRRGIQKPEETVNIHVFLVIILSQLSCLCFFLSDYLVTRLPSTGALTSWCQQSQPNRFLGLIFSLNVYFNYTVMMYPVLLSLVRLIPIYFPTSFNERNKTVLKYSIPFIHIYPLFLTSFMFPAIGVCRQHEKPFLFGSVYIHFYGSWHDMINAPFQLTNCLFWLICCLLVNILLYRNIKSLSHCSLRTNRSVKYQKAEVSLTLTTTAMLLAYLTNIVFLCTFLADTRIAAYSLVFRPFGNDLKTCAVSLVFYMTHPAFKPASESSSSQQTGRALLGNRV